MMATSDEKQPDILVDRLDVLGEEARTSEEQHKTSEEAFDYDEILKHIGEMGKSQILHVLLICLPVLFPSIALLSYTFTGAIPRYRCRIESCDASDSNAVYEPEWWSVRMLSNDLEKGCLAYMADWNGTDCLRSSNDTTLTKCDSWVYDQSEFQATTFTDFNLTCEDEWQQAFAMTIYIVGCAFGAPLWGNLSDKMGRKNTYLATILSSACFCIGTSFAPNYATFVVLRFFSGLASEGVWLVSYVWGIESVGPKYRVLSGCLYQIFYAIGSIVLGGTAYFIRDWRTLQLVISVPIFLMVGHYWVLSESVRWLINKKRYNEAEQVILKMAKANGKTVPPHLLIAPTDEEVLGASTQGLESTRNLCEKPPAAETAFDALRNRSLWKRLAILVIAWFAMCVGYFGITFSLSNLEGDLYLNFLIGMIVEIPAQLSAIYIIDKIGRRPTLTGSLLLTGVFCLITGFVPSDPEAIRLVFSLLGRCFAAISSNCIYTFTTELFPTSSRSTIMGITSLGARIGGIAAPFIAQTGRTINAATPFIIFAGIAISVGLLTLLLPETKGKPMPTTIQQALDLEIKNRINEPSTKEVPYEGKS